jgi:hypothetical protein
MDRHEPLRHTDAMAKVAAQGFGAWLRVVVAARHLGLCGNNCLIDRRQRILTQQPCDAFERSATLFQYRRHIASFMACLSGLTRSQAKLSRNGLVGVSLFHQLVTPTTWRRELTCTRMFLGQALLKSHSEPACLHILPDVRQRPFANVAKHIIFDWIGLILKPVLRCFSMPQTNVGHDTGGYVSAIRDETGI